MLKYFNTSILQYFNISTLFEFFDYYTAIIIPVFDQLLCPIQGLIKADLILLKDVCLSNLNISWLYLINHLKRYWTLLWCASQYTRTCAGAPMLPFACRSVKQSQWDLRDADIMQWQGGNFVDWKLGCLLCPDSRQMVSLWKWGRLLVMKTAREFWPRQWHRKLEAYHFDQPPFWIIDLSSKP